LWFIYFTGTYLYFNKKKNKKNLVMFGFNKKIFISSILFVLLVLFAKINVLAFTEVDNGSIDIGFSVPSICGNGVREGSEACDDGNLVSGDGCSSTCSSGGNPPYDPPPVISNIVKITNSTTAKISWQATDNSGTIANQFFRYGIGDYIQSGIINSLGADLYEVNLLDLNSNITYFFSIEATDPFINKTTIYDQFQTVVSLDSTAPNISNIVAAPSIDSCLITWDTSELANSEIKYGLTNLYGSSVSDVSFLLSHSVTLNNLIPNVLYNFHVLGTDNSGNTTSTSNHTFTTLPDNIPPDPPISMVLSIVGGAFKIDWVNPALSGVNADFAGVKLLRTFVGPSPAPTEGTLLYNGSNNTYIDNSVISGVNYYFTLFTYDTSGNYSSGVSVHGVINPTENCDNKVDDDSDGLIDCVDAVDCSATVYCAISTSSENCTDRIDNDNDNLVDCLDLADCANNQACVPRPIEICGNGLDDDGDNLIDCGDSDCSGYANCGTNNSSACNDGIDNDNDVLVDFPNDPGCNDSSDLDEYNAPAITVADFQRLTIEKVIFNAGNGKISLIPKNQTITSLAGSDLQVKILTESLSFPEAKLSLKLVGTNYLFVYNELEKNYYLSLAFPAVGLSEANLEVEYGANGFDVLSFKLNALGFGLVKDDKNIALSDAEIALYEKNGSVFPGNNFAETNPYFTNINGGYGFVVPNGEYYLSVKKEGFHERITPIFLVSNNVVNKNVDLIKKIEELIVADPEQTIKNLVNKLTEITALTSQTVTDLVDNLEVEKASKKIVAPISIGIVAMSTLPFLSFSNLLPFLRLLFLQPLFLLGRKKREKWGQVYSALNKLPIDLAIVRLVNAETGKILQSKVTDKNGRYAFVVEPGKYKLIAEKTGFIFPSSLLSGIKTDGRRVDVYHNELIEVNEKDSIITANIPLDTVGVVNKKLARLVWQKIGRSFQNIIAVLGFVLTVVSFYISPVWYIGALLLVHILLFLLFHRLAKPIKTKGWGIVYDSENKKPVGKAVARLFNAELNKLVASQVTDRKGRYYFLAGDDKYYVTFEHPEYQTLKTEIVDLSNKEADTVAVDVQLAKINSESGVIKEKELEKMIVSKEKIQVIDRAEVKDKKEDIFG